MMSGTWEGRMSGTFETPVRTEFPSAVTGPVATISPGCWPGERAEGLSLRRATSRGVKYSQMRN